MNEDLEWILKKVIENKLLPKVQKMKRCRYRGQTQYACLVQKYNCVYEQHLYQKKIK